MPIRPVEPTDLPVVVELVIETFRPFYEGLVRPMYGEAIFANLHGRWEQDYRDEVPTLHDPDAGRHTAVATDDDKIVGCVSWKVGESPAYGEIYLLAVSADARRDHLGRGLCEHAIARMKADGVEVVGIGTGDDAFHAAARSLYESLGFLKVAKAGYLRSI